MYKIKQFRYSNFNPPPLSENLFLVNDAYSTTYPVVQLGIQAPPGTKILINAVDTSANSDIEIGYTGIFELDLRDANTYITWLSILNIPGFETYEEWEIFIDFLYET